MKHFLEVLFVAIAVVAMMLGYTVIAIWSAMFAIIFWAAPNSSVKKTPEDYLNESRKLNVSGAEVEFEFLSDKGKTFTVKLEPHLYINDDMLMDSLVEYIVKHTGIQTSSERLNIISIKK
ncbi:hypothetical protein [Yersinia phage fHe-Yen9-04]|uniref:Uncharacterized protein n=1 Tax=Yersinia phage fHe-Yen9-04 TaxID=2052742 RepID=A0A2C9CXZ5_9CAUD|nr:membrane protein [Yersinia phage fHe-Yen9-04]SOK58717.1 hypothetical protein [Yersinia phage fHe-Yen9-04]VUE36486.1 hypothetical protein [Yersinia phage fHe-Yen9-04]